jgi:hypothetical protein
MAVQAHLPVTLVQQEQMVVQQLHLDSLHSVVVVEQVDTILQLFQRAVEAQVAVALVPDSLAAVMVEVQEQEQLDKVIMVLPAVLLGIQVAVVEQARQQHNQAAKSATVAWVFLIAF